jgi:hypothetical protein
VQRILYSSARLKIVILATAIVACVGSAYAQLRSIPEEAKRGQMRYVRETIVEIDGAQARLSPGAQIRTADNRILLPSALPQDPMLVKYVTDAAGMLHRVWILTQEEAARPDKKQ